MSIVFVDQIPIREDLLIFNKYYSCPSYIPVTINFVHDKLTAYLLGQLIPLIKDLIFHLR